MVKIGHIQDISLIDYPGKVVSNIFVIGCNLRCPYCHNWKLLNDKEMIPIPLNSILKDLEKISDLIDGICITGGEPTIYDDLPEFIQTFKDIGLKVKLDTNGTNSKMIRRCLPLLDYVAMDVKSNQYWYYHLGSDASTTSAIRESARLIHNSGVDHEFRCTTVYPFLSHERKYYIARIIVGGDLFVLQKPNLENVLDPDFPMCALDLRDVTELRDFFKPYVKSIEIRGYNQS